jgi:atypical dual specificity phosphatase
MTTDEVGSPETNSGPVRTVPSDADPDQFPRALVARIGERDIWIANSGGVEVDHLAAMELDPAYVVSVNHTATEATTDHHPLKDGYVNDQGEVRAAVEATRQRLRQSGSVIVNCAAGISRSTTVSATAIAAEEEVGFDAVVQEIKKTRPRARPHPKLQLNALAYLANTENRSDAREKFKQLASETPVRRTDDCSVEELLSSDFN